MDTRCASRARFEANAWTDVGQSSVLLVPVREQNMANPGALVNTPSN